MRSIELLLVAQLSGQGPVIDRPICQMEMAVHGLGDLEVLDAENCVMTFDQEYPVLLTFRHPKQKKQP